MANDTSSSTKTTSFWLLIIAMVIILIVWATFGWYIIDNSNRDMFEAVNALFSGLAFATLVYTIALQRNELSLQRHELELNRKELEGQKLQLESQNKMFYTQNLENTFFQMLRMHNDIVSHTDIQIVNKDKLVGRDCYRYLYRDRFNREYLNYAQKHPESTEVDKLEKSYELFFSKYQSDLGHYFRHLYHIFKFINSVEIGDKRFFSNIIVSQLSSFELLLVFYNGISSFGEENFKPLIETFGIFEQMDIKLLLNQEHIKLYKESAFGLSQIGTLTSHSS